MKDFKIIKRLNQHFNNVSYVNTLDDIIYIYNTRIIEKFPWMEELSIEFLLNYPIPSCEFSPDKNYKTLRILIRFNEMPTVPEFEIVIKKTIELGLNQIYH